MATCPSLIERRDDSCIIHLCSLRGSTATSVIAALSVAAARPSTSSCLHKFFWPHIVDSASYL